MEDEKSIRVFADKKQIKSCKTKLLKVEKPVKQVANILNLAGNQVRFKILYLLNEEGKLCVCDLSNILDMKISAISQHLRKLRDSDLVKFKKAGQTVFYSLTKLVRSTLLPHFKKVNHKGVTQ